MTGFDDVRRVLAAVAALALFALNDLRLLNGLPRVPTPGHEHALWLNLMGAPAPVYLTTFDLAVRWGLFGLILAACVWAVAETLRPTSAAPPEKP